MRAVSVLFKERLQGLSNTVDSGIVSKNGIGLFPSLELKFSEGFAFLHRRGNICNKGWFNLFEALLITFAGNCSATYPGMGTWLIKTWAVNACFSWLLLTRVMDITNLDPSHDLGPVTMTWIDSSPVSFVCACGSGFFVYMFDYFLYLIHIMTFSCHLKLS